MLSVSCTCGVSLYLNCSGKSLSIVANAAMKATLNGWIACSVAFTWWLWGSTTCILQLFLVRNFLMCFVA